MQTDIYHLPYRETGSFSSLVYDYIDQHEQLRCYYQYTPDEKGLAAAIADRSRYPVNRQLLADTLQKQYADFPKQEAVLRNIEALRNEDTFTVCTAHQPNLMTGYLYFVYKIIHAIKLAEDLNVKYPEKHFVPVYYIGSEDNDLDELGTFRYNGQKFIWDAGGQRGAVGRMDTKSLKPLLAELFKLLGPPGPHEQELKRILADAYTGHKTIAAATQFLVNELFGRYGLIALDADVPAFKQQIAYIIKDDLLHHTALQLVEAQAAKLSEHYKSQAYPRAINLFYLQDQLRERIEQVGDHFEVLNTGIRFTQQQLLAELEAHPERFSPNVILRGMLQETILPDVAFIGGGAEVAYWFQLKTTFDHYKVFYPAVLLRKSVLWIPAEAAELRRKIQLDIADLFLPLETLNRKYVNERGEDDWRTSHEQVQMQELFGTLTLKASGIDSTLKTAAASVLKKMEKQLHSLEQKMYRAEKRKMHTQLQRVERLKAWLFPNNSLQERFDNFMPWFLESGDAYFDVLKDNMRSLDHQFMIVEATSA